MEDRWQRYARAFPIQRFCNRIYLFHPVLISDSPSSSSSFFSAMRLKLQRSVFPSVGKMQQRDASDFRGNHAAEPRTPNQPMDAQGNTQFPWNVNAIYTDDPQETARARGFPLGRRKGGVGRPRRPTSGPASCARTYRCAITTVLVASLDYPQPPTTGGWMGLPLSKGVFPVLMETFASSFAYLFRVAS